MKTALGAVISLLLVTPAMASRANCDWSALPGKAKAEVETMCGTPSLKQEETPSEYALLRRLKAEVLEHPAA
jgi:hypothetical protein